MNLKRARISHSFTSRRITIGCLHGLAWSDLKTRISYLTDPSRTRNMPLLIIWIAFLKVPRLTKRKSAYVVQGTGTHIFKWCSNYSISSRHFNSISKNGSVLFPELQNFRFHFTQLENIICWWYSSEPFCSQVSSFYTVLLNWGDVDDVVAVLNGTLE